MIQSQLDATRVEAFEGRMLEVLNDAALALMLSIGHRTGLFDVLAGLPPASSEEVARAAGLQERHVREWLGAMVTGGVVEHDPRAGTYVLPPEHAARLTRSASPANLTVPMQWIGVLAGVEDRVVECFRRGGGVRYEEFGRFHEVMAEESAQTTVAGLLDGIVGLEAGLGERLARGLDVLEVGCGRGRALIDLALAFDAIHDQRDPARVLRGVREALRERGLFLMQDIRASSRLERNLEHPLGPFFYTISTMHCMTVSLAHGGAGLGTCWGEELAVAMLRQAGFAQVDIHQLPHDIQNNYYLARP